MDVRLVLITVVAVFSTNTLFAQSRDVTPRGSTAEVKLSAAASDELRRLQAAGGFRVEQRRNDSVLNGVLIGAAAGVVSGLAVCRMMEPWDVCLEPAPLLRLGAVGAAIGAGVDALIRKRDVVELRGSQVLLAPVAGPGAKGLRVAVRF